ncbi:hypothetical protein ACH5RR_031752 [Cinchona calisaya]|uniref:F-box domain-containing protein n=1 Tax=Cinchona calisaya TaxID=153742 RepID=A0ABD2YJJ9_9GENT
MFTIWAFHFVHSTHSRQAFTKINHQMEESPFSSPSAPNQELDPLIFPNFPHELLIEILSSLPVKSLVKFKCVSRTWLSLISSPHFIKTHLKISSNLGGFTHHGLILTVWPPVSKMDIKTISANPHCLLKNYLNQCSLESALGAPSKTEVIDVAYPMKSPYKSVRIVGLCNGLICLGFFGTLLLENPRNCLTLVFRRCMIVIVSGFCMMS